MLSETMRSLLEEMKDNHGCISSAAGAGAARAALDEIDRLREALAKIRDGYHVNHTSKFAHSVAKTALSENEQ